MADVLDDAEIARVLSITAHPDDVDFAAAGTMARWTEAGIEVVYCVVTDPDGRVEATLALRRDLARVIRQVRPDRVVCPSPERRYDRIGISHPDHRAVGAAALDAVYPDARNPFAFPELRDDEGLAAWAVREVWIASGTPNHYLDVTETFPRKVAALRAHESQTAHLDDLPERLRTRMGRMAAQAGFADGRLAEGFQVLDTA